MIATLHTLKSKYAVYPSIRQFHEMASQACLAGSQQQKGEPLFVQPVGSTRKRGVVDHTTGVEELIIRPLTFEDATSRNQILAWLPAISDSPYYEWGAQERQRVCYDIQAAWAEATRRYADLQKITRLLADEIAILKDYYAEIGKRLGRVNQGVWEEINNENVDRNVWEALHKEARRNTYLSRAMNTVDKLIQIRKNELQKKIALLAEEHQAYKAMVPTLEKRIAAEMASIEEQQTTFRNYVRRISETLIQDPGPLGEKRVLKESDVKETLLNPPKRQAYVRVGGDINQKPRKYTMQTTDARQAVKQDEAKQRHNRVREQTRSKYCQPRVEVERGYRERPINPPRGEDEHRDDAPPESWYEE